MRVDRRLLGWGLFFILVGAIPLATRFGSLDPRVVGGWLNLWPLLLIAWGLGLLLRSTPLEWLGGGLAALTLGIMGGALLAAGFAGAPIMTGCGGPDPGTPFQTQSGTMPGSGRMDIVLNCGTVTLQPADGTTWSVAGTESEGRAPRIRTEGQTILIDAGERRPLFDPGGRTDWTISIPRATQVGIGLTINAGEGTADLDGATLGSINATVNAGSARIDLAGADTLGDLNATVNAGSAVFLLPPGGRSGNISLNAGSVNVCAPSGTQARVTWGGALGSNDLDDAGLVKVDDDTWQTANFDPGVPFLDLRVSANAGSFDLELQGTCDG
ncbi:MAG TPA: hypothetical protein VNL94_05875 [Candidatus Binatia bacterium]|nr:hypothetical protein [Candidatus Binatia bacterium]